MADQTIAIRMILRDEMSKPLADIHRQIDRLAGARISGVTGQMQSFGGAMRLAHRELSALSRLAIGGLIGGGIVASIVGITKALGDMAREGLQLRYQAEALRVTPAFFEQMTDGLQALGEDAGQAKSSVSNLINTLRDAEVQGTESPLFKRLEKGVRGTGIVLWRQIREQLRGPEGAEGAFKWLIERMRTMHPTGQRALLQQLGLSSLAFKDLQEVLPKLNQRIRLSRDEMLALNVANTNFEISMSNIGRQLGAAVMPGLAKIMKALDDYLKTDNGKKFAAELKDWSDKVGDAVAKWIREGGLKTATDELKKAVDEITKAFTAADKVIHDMGLTWPQAILALVGLSFAPWLLAVGQGLAGIARYTGILSLLARLSPAALIALTVLWLRGVTGQDEASEKAAEELRKRNREQLDKVPGLTPEQKENLDKIPWLRRQPGTGLVPQPQSGEGTPKTEQERRADMQEEKNQRELLKNEFAQLSTELGQLNSYFQVGGPEGTADGTSGFGAGVSGSDLAGPADGTSAGVGGGALPSFSRPAIPPGTFAARARMEKWAPWSAMRRAENQQFHEAAQRFMRGYQEWENPEERSAFEGGRNIPPAEHFRGLEGEMEQRLKDYSGHWDMPNWNRPGGNALTFAKYDHARAENAQDWLGEAYDRRKGNERLSLLGTSGGMPGDESGPSPIIRHLASEGSSRLLSGSATVDIDVGGLNAPPPDPDELFRPQPLGGSVQMQNATHPRHNPLSFQ